MTPLDVARIRRETADLALRPDVRYVPETDSTNRMAAALRPGEWRSGTAILTDYQRAGKGRQGRSWQAPPGTGLLLSILLHLPPPILASDGLMVGALAIADAIADVASLAPAIKWPNDVLIRGLKVCGVLAEFSEQADQRRLVLGIGLNVSVDPTALGVAGATSVSAEAGHDISREDLAVALFKRLDMWYCALTEEPDAVFAAWRGRLETLGHPVIVLEAGSTWHGEAVGVHRNGGLQVRTAGGEIRTVYAADVSLRRAQCS
jgi:BirA family biotin operon repressor/biotin-[acetyl-CoA-carboxylase] ligase